MAGSGPGHPEYIRTGGTTSITQPILLYDDTCGLCHWLVRLVLRTERTGQILFAPLDSPAGRALLTRHRVPVEIDSVVLIVPEGALVRSDAVVRISGTLRWPWRFMALGRAVPRPVRDWIYDFLARRRRQVASGLDLACTVPTLAERGRFIDAVPNHHNEMA